MKKRFQRTVKRKISMFLSTTTYLKAGYEDAGTEECDNNKAEALGRPTKTTRTARAATAATAAITATPKSTRS